MKKNELKIGDEVLVLDEDIKGIITQISADTISVESSEGFIFEFSSKELIKLEHDTELRVNTFSSSSPKEVAAQKEIPKKRSFKSKPKERFQPSLEVDLHIHQLTASSKGMANHEMLTLQLETAKRQLEFAIRKNIQRVVFVHGVGEGVLKLELEYLFGRYSNLKFYDANYQKYGLGATEVYIYQNPRTP